jgi:hypothetical protein
MTTTRGGGFLSFIKDERSKGAFYSYTGAVCGVVVTVVAKYVVATSKSPSGAGSRLHSLPLITTPLAQGLPHTLVQAS